MTPLLRLPRLLALLGAVVAGLALAGVLTATAAPAAPSSVADDGRTWVVDAVDDGEGNRWESVDTGTSEVVITVGDTVEWQFDRAAMAHDLVSEDTRSTWTPPLVEHREAGGEPVRRTFTQPGTYHYLCTIHGTLMTGVVVVAEVGANRPPTLTTTVEPRTGPAPLDVHATALATDPDGDPLTYRWDFGTGDAVATTAHTMYRYETPGAYTATLEVSDGRGGVAREEFAITVGASSTVTATATPAAGTVPLTVDFAAGAEGSAPSYAWDFGDGTTGTGAAPAHVYDEPGTYTATVTATDGDEELGSDTLAITAADALPEVAATATPAAGLPPLAVAFSTEVTTTGTFTPYADGTATFPDLAGEAVLVRSRGSSYASLDVTGLTADATHNVHVHEQACGVGNGGAHFRFDETQPFTEPNEIWLPFTSGAGGASGLVKETQPLRAGPKAVSIVIHDPANPAKRIGCADLGPSTADLTYTWDFGDGTTGEGTDPDHTYAAAGTYTATVTVASVHAGHGMGLDDTVSATVEVEVLDVVAPQTTIAAGPSGTVATDRATFRLASSETGSTLACRLDGAAWKACGAAPAFRGLRDGPHRLEVRATDASGNADATPATRRWTVDTTGPAVRRTSPRATADRTPSLRATVADRLSKVRSVVVRVDGRVALARYDARRGTLVAEAGRRLRPGAHTVKVVAVDVVGNRSVTTWRVRVR
jgi:PKD repeat protein